MIVIKNIEILTTDKNEMEIYSTTPPYHPVLFKEGPVDVEVFKELIKGRRFVRPSDGTDIIVGVSKQAADIIGLQYEAWEEINSSLEACHASCLKSKMKIESIKAAGFWRRLVWLFTGVKNT